LYRVAPSVRGEQRAVAAGERTDDDGAAFRSGSTGCTRNYTR